ncbi:polysaccharide chain length determinant protein [Salmonella phage vB_SalP_SE29]|uniref:Polysaccharide chain length determinant protein n=1 Tax=Salmonella phage vB_SalP_SE29 TaxID=3134913 RepID=A0AAX4LXH0_9CAUD
MSMVTILVSLSQYLRNLSVRMKNKAVTAIKDRMAVVVEQQVEVEEHRYNLMIDCHNRFYAEEARLKAEFEAKMEKLKADFQENKRTIALTSQAASNELKRELAMLGAELDNLTK